MARYLLLKHYQGAPEPVNCIPMSEWTPEEVSDHIKFMQDFGTRLEGTGELAAPNLAEREHQTRQAARVNQVRRMSG